MDERVDIEMRLERGGDFVKGAINAGGVVGALAGGAEAGEKRAAQWWQPWNATASERRLRLGSVLVFR